MFARLCVMSALSASTLASGPLWADSRFNLTYHVERHAASALPLETCASVVSDGASEAGLESVVTDYPGQLATITGGTESQGAFVVQCIAVDDKTVTVVQGIDYAQQKGAFGSFADQVHAALVAAAP